MRLLFKTESFPPCRYGWAFIAPMGVEVTASAFTHGQEILGLAHFHFRWVPYEDVDALVHLITHETLHETLFNAMEMDASYALDKLKGIYNFVSFERFAPPTGAC